MVPGSQPAPRRLMPRGLAAPQINTVAEVPWGVLMPALGPHRHSGTDPRNSQRARRVVLACEVVSEDHITASKTARGAIADPDFHLPHENKNVLSPGRGVPVAPMVRRETAEHEVSARLECNVLALLGRQREIFKMGLAVVARIYPYHHARAPSHREIIVHAKAYSALSSTTKPPAFLLRTLPPECQDFCTAGRPLSTLRRSFSSARKRPAHAAKRPKLPLIAQDKPGFSRTDL